MTEIDRLLLGLSDRKIELTGDITRIGLRVPLIRKQVKKALALSGDTEKERLSFWDAVWKDSPYFESMSLALYVYQHRSLTRAEFSKLKTWATRITCWEHSDDLSKIYAQVVEDSPEWILPVLRKWNSHRSLWKRRQSVVSLLEYATKRKKVQPFDVLIGFITPLLTDTEYYVQKGVGWTLREIYTVYPKETVMYLQENLLSISATAYSPATEKLDRKLKTKLNSVRKAAREKARDSGNSS